MIPSIRSTEIRIGLVMYGGVSLAVYMNGVAREFFDMVRGRGMWGAWKILADVDVVVDVLSGASAGGINGLFLAKALAAEREFAPLADLWRNNAGIESLLRQASEREPRSLLDSEYMHGALADAFRKMDATPVNTAEDLCPSRVEELDCFVAATHYYGLSKTVRDYRGGPVDVKSHRAMLRFRHRRGRREPFGAAAAHSKPETAPLSSDTLADVARATSAFPFAFRPQQLDLEALGPYFEGWGNELSGKAWFVDGGILDNKPFGATLSAIYERHADRPVDRLLFYVEPDPEHFEANSSLAEPGFDRVALAALTSLPSYESILGDLDSIERHNQRLKRIQTIFGEAMKPWAAALDTSPIDTRQIAVYWRSRIDAILSSLCEPMKEELKGAFLASLPQPRQTPSETGTAQDDARSAAIQGLLEFLQSQRREGEPDLPAAPLRRALEGLDLGFLKRAVNYWIYAISDGLQSSDGPEPSAPWLHGWNLSPVGLTKAQLQDTVRSLNHLADGILVLEAGVAYAMRGAGAAVAADGGFLDAWLAGVGSVEAQVDALNTLHNAPPQQGPRSLAAVFKRNTAAGAVPRERPEDPWDRALALAQALGNALDAIVARRLPHVRAVDTFFRVDVWRFPALHLANVTEMDRVEYFRISPIDSPAPEPWLADSRWKNDGMRKVTGKSLAHFSAFLKRSWRSNDIMWGRLDASAIAWDAFVRVGAHKPKLDPLRLATLSAALKEIDGLTDLKSLVAALHQQPEQDVATITHEMLVCHQRSIVAEELPRIFRDAMDEELQRRESRLQRSAKKSPASKELREAALTVLAHFDDACTDPLLRKIASRAVEEIAKAKKMELPTVFAEDYDVGNESIFDLPSPWLETTALQAARVVANMIKGLVPGDNSVGAWIRKQVLDRTSAVLTGLHWILLARQRGWFAILWLVATFTSLGMVMLTYLRHQPWSWPMDYAAAAAFAALLLVPGVWLEKDRRALWTRRILYGLLAIGVVGLAMMEGLAWADWFDALVAGTMAPKLLRGSLVLNVSLLAFGLWTVVFGLGRKKSVAKSKPAGNQRGL